MTDHSRPTDYRAMLVALVRRVLLVSVLPLIVIASANFLLFFSLNRSIVLDQQANLLRYHRESIEAFLANLTAEVTALAHQYPREELVNGHLERLFQVLQQSAKVITDIGVIDSAGQHLKYVGPFDLAGRNYRATEWFAEVVERGYYISDVFTGFRAVPHFIIAVKRAEGNDFWILRVTVNTDYFSRLVDAAHVGRTGETFIVNREGRFQTKTRFGDHLLEPSGFPDLSFHEGIKVRSLKMGGVSYLCTTTWLSNPRWLLIFRQQVRDVYAPLRNAVVVGLLMSAAGVLGAGVLAVLFAHRQVQALKRADAENEALLRRLVATGKTAAVGEMSAGLAHEINNPLATIDTLQTWIRDLAGSPAMSEADRLEVLDAASKIGDQVARCKAITQGLLKFARRVDASPQPVLLSPMLEEMATVMRARARIEGITLEADLADVPAVLGAPAHLQQIFMNLINNALDATSGRGDGRVVIRTRASADAVRVEIQDNGPGIPPEHLSSIFLPFFTTKPVGKGTGLGLAICYGLVQELHGSIEVDSRPGHGTTFTVTLPRAAQEGT
jgi:two-component system NtrC family sensor kinase